MSYLAFEHTAVAARPALTRTITGVLLVFTLLTTAFASGAAARDGIDLRAVTADPGPDVGPITPAVHEFVADDVGLIVAAGPSPVGRLTGQNWSRSPGCDVDFNDADALNIQPGQAITQFVSDPWREACGTVFTEIEGSIYDHLHLDFVDPDIGPCLNPWEELAGSYARIIGDDPWEATCEEIDRLTEPRTSPWAHGSDEVVRIRTYVISARHLCRCKAHFTHVFSTAIGPPGIMRGSIDGLSTRGPTDS